MQQLSQERLQALAESFHWKLRVLDEVDSTNSALKREQNLPNGTVLLVRQQVGGRGRLGRQFSSPEGGLYLSVLLRPEVQPAQLLHLTPMVAVAVRRAIMDCCGLEVSVKWINDLVYQGKKLGGILTEYSDGVIIGIGINCNTDMSCLPPEVQEMATSLAEILDHSLDLNDFASAVLRRLEELTRVLLTEKTAWLREFEAACITVGKPVAVICEGQRKQGLALGIDEVGGLIVRWESGETENIRSGEVSVRGLYGYT